MEVLSRLKIDFAVIGFSDSPSIHKTFGEKFKYKNKDELISEVDSYMGHGGTNDSGAVDKAVELLDNEISDTKVVVVVTDGYGNIGDTLDNALSRGYKKRIDTIGIGIGADMNYVKEAYDLGITVEDLQALPVAMAQVLVDIVIRGKHVRPKGRVIEEVDSDQQESQSKTRNFIGILKNIISRQDKLEDRKIINDILVSGELIFSMTGLHEADIDSVIVKMRGRAPEFQYNHYTIIVNKGKDDEIQFPIAVGKGGRTHDNNAEEEMIKYDDCVIGSIISQDKIYDYVARPELDISDSNYTKNSYDYDTELQLKLEQHKNRFVEICN